MKHSLQRFLATLFISLCLTGSVLAADKKDTDKPALDPMTTGNPEIPIDELELLLRPLTRDQLEAETSGWLALLQEKVSEISEAEIGAKHKRVEMQFADDLQAALDRVEQSKQKADANPDDSAAAAALEADIAGAGALKEKTQAAIREMENNAAVMEVIEAAMAYSATHTTEKGDAAENDTKPMPEPNDRPAAELDERDQKLAQAQLAVSKAAAEREATREQLLEYINYLRTQQTILIDRTNTVITAWEQKGGDPTEARQYISAISGIKVDVTDAEATWKTISGWVTSEEGGYRWMKNIAIFLVTLLVFYFLSKLAVRGTRKLFAKTVNTSQLLEDFMIVTVRRLVIAIGFLVALTTLEVNVGPLLAVIGAAGFVVAFALQDSLGNFASGILILLFRPFDVGDLVEIGGIQGRVKSVNLLSVQIFTPDNQMVIVPNNSVWGSSITNVTGSDTRRVDLIFGISYDDDIEQAQHIMEDIVSHHPLVLKDPESVIAVHELADSSVNFVCRPWVKTEDYWTVYWDLTRAVKQRFDAEGISIPFPQQDVHHYNVASAGPVDAPALQSKPVERSRPVTTDQDPPADHHDDG
jgi:small conductance mechanosensitive channel